MKAFQKLTFDPDRCREELEELKALLASYSSLDERRDILPFFRERHHLSVFVGSYLPDIINFDLIAFEYSLFGDFSVDLAVGDSQTGCYCFVEFEDATPTSIFEQRGVKATLDWSPRFEHGLSQIVDWFWKLADMRNSVEFQSRFGRDYIKYSGMLIIGRSGQLGYKERLRLAWRLDKMLVDSKQVICLTFDELAEDLDKRLMLYRTVSASE